MDKDQQDTGGDTGDMREGGATAGSDATSLLGNTRKNNKRKRLITEFCREEDSDFDTRRVQRIKLPNSQDTVTSKSAKISETNGSTRTTSDSGGPRSKKSKSAGLASYLLSKKSSSSVEPELSQDQSSTAAWDTHSPTTEAVDEGASSATSSTVEYDCADYNCPSDSEWLFEDCDLAAFSNFDDDTAN